MSNKAISFRSSCIKTLSAVEANPARSNQHEFNGVTELKALFGTEKLEIQVNFSIRGEKTQAIANMTWYDAREAHATRSEYRLYFQSNSVMDQAKEGDNVVVGLDINNLIHCILIKRGTSGHRHNINNWQQI